MRREAEAASGIRLVEFVRSFHIGGTEGQVVELLRGLPSDYRVGVGLISPLGPWTGQVAELGYPPREFPIQGSMVHWETLRQIHRMAAWLREERIQLLHAHDFYGALLAVPAAKLAGCKVIIGRLDLAHWQNRVQRRVLALWTRLADHVIANARAIKAQLVAEEGIAPARISVVHNGIDLEAFDARAARGLMAPVPKTQGEPIILHVANMNHVVKRQEDAISALAHLTVRGVRARLFLVGDGPRRPLLEQLVRGIGVSDRVSFLGRRLDVPALYARAAVGVLCSTHEGMPNAVIEGMASRRPMVVTRAGGTTDLVEDGVRGRLVAPEKPVELAEAIGEVLANPERARRMGESARHFVERELTVSRMVAQHDAVYRRVLGKPC
jgi:glycosyltransferase involved in cell wall biosynthesis